MNKADEDAMKEFSKKFSQFVDENDWIDDNNPIVKKLKNGVRISEILKDNNGFPKCVRETEIELEKE